MSTLDDRIREVRNSSEDYTSTVYAVLAFGAFVVHDGKGQRAESGFGFGRRMDTSGANVVLPSDEVTPDLIAQKSASYGLACEVKRSLPSDAGHWGDTVEQLRKYDDQLTGWWTATETIAVSDAALLVHQSRSRAFLKYLQEQLNDDPELLSEHSAVVEFNRSDEANAYMFFRQEWGNIHDDELREHLQDGVPVPIDRVLRSFGQIKFYDAPPPTPWLMAMLWTDVFLSSYDPTQFDEKKKATPIQVSAQAVTAELQRAYGSGALSRDERSKAFPRELWVRRALDAFVTAKLAIPGDSPDEYTILYKTFRGDIMARFVTLTEGAPAPEGNDGPQTSLHLDDERHE